MNPSDEPKMLTSEAVATIEQRYVDRLDELVDMDALLRHCAAQAVEIERLQRVVQGKDEDVQTTYSALQQVARTSRNIVKMKCEDCHIASMVPVSYIANENGIFAMPVYPCAVCGGILRLDIDASEVKHDAI